MTPTSPVRQSKPHTPHTLMKQAQQGHRRGGLCSTLNRDSIGRTRYGGVITDPIHIIIQFTTNPRSPPPNSPVPPLPPPP